MYNTKVYHKQGGDALVIAPGGRIETEAGNDLDILKRYLTLDIADLSAEATYYLISSCAGKVTSIKSITDGAVSSADVTVTASINGAAITNGVVTIATAASAAGDMDEAIPTAANDIEVGDKLSFAVTGGGSGGAPRGHLLIEVTAQ